MGVVIDEMVAKVESSNASKEGGEREAHATENQQHGVINQLELIQERKARLVVD